MICDEKLNINNQYQFAVLVIQSRNEKHYFSN